MDYHIVSVATAGFLCVYGFTTGNIVLGLAGLVAGIYLILRNK